MAKPLLVGLHNPLSPEPQFALYPKPEGCTGWRIAEMLRPAFTHHDYLRVFDRMNLLRHDELIGGVGYATQLRQAGTELMDRIARGRHENVVLFGRDVWWATIGRDCSQSRPPWLYWQVAPVADLSVHFTPIPHPSGRNRWYNDPENAAAAARKLQQLAVVGLEAT